jgi:hypothetical protein
MGLMEKKLKKKSSKFSDDSSDSNSDDSDLEENEEEKNEEIEENLENISGELSFLKDPCLKLKGNSEKIMTCSICIPAPFLLDINSIENHLKSKKHLQSIRIIKEVSRTPDQVEKQKERNRRRKERKLSEYLKLKEKGILGEGKKEKKKWKYFEKLLNKKINKEEKEKEEKEKEENIKKEINNEVEVKKKKRKRENIEEEKWGKEKKNIEL